MGTDEVELYTTDRALCYFQAIIIDDDARIARASLGQFRRAANALILECAAGGESQGGVAMNIGMYMSFLAAPTPLPHLFPRRENQKPFMKNAPLTLFKSYLPI